MTAPNRSFTLVRPPRCPTCDEKMVLCEAVMRMFSTRRMDNGIWLVYQCRDNKHLPLHVKARKKDFEER